MKKITNLILLLFICNVTIFSREAEGTMLPAWAEGELEIHHIHTGRGNATFCIFPDGTTMLIDAGDIGPYRDPRTTPALPDDSRQPGEWIARYILNRLNFTDQKQIDYAFMTHFHGDHMGGVYKNSPKTGQGGDYYLSGLTEVYEHIPFSKLVDRDWPAYSNPVPLKGAAIENYKKFIEWQLENNNLKMERFVPGSNSQFTLANQSEKYPQFEVRNIIGTGELWTGEGENTRYLVQPGTPIHENKLSSGIRISYGKFDYFNGADINGRLPLNTQQWRDVETPAERCLARLK